MKGWGWLPAALAAAILLVGCNTMGRDRPPPTAEADATRQTTVTTAPQPQTPVGEWTTDLPAADLLRLATASPQALTLLGEDNVEKLQLAASLIGDLQTKAILTLVLQFAEDGTASIVLPQSGMKRATETILREYSPVLAALLSSQIVAYLPADIVLPATYVQNDLTVQMTTDTGEWLLTLQGENLAVQQMSDSRMTASDEQAATAFFRNCLFLRNAVG